MDPRDIGPAGRSTNHSDLMKQLVKAGAGQKVNACPYGCSDEKLDVNGYCHHLVGFTNDGKVLEPMRRDGERRIVCGAEPERIKKTDKIVRITISSRVYRDVPDDEPAEANPITVDE